MELDQIKIEGLEIFANHGVFPEENVLGQKFIVSATLYTDTRKAGKTDELTASIHYGEVSAFITEFIKSHTYKLLERVAEELVEDMLQKFDGLEKVTLEIQKPWAPIGLPLENVSVEISRGWHKVYLSVGSNLGERQQFLQAAVNLLHECREIRKVKVSNLIETAPYGYTDQPPFLNGAVELETLFTPQELLHLLNKIEAELGRERLIHWGPRTVDLDIIFYDDEIIAEADLIIPHVDMQNRLFVLEPLNMLCPGKVHPVLHRTVAQLRQELLEKAEHR
mgnify:CR=1 FL=1